MNVLDARCTWGELVQRAYCFSLLSILAVMAMVGHTRAQGLERVSIVPDSSAYGFAYPSIARMGDDRLMCVFSRLSQDAKDGRTEAVIAATYSQDNGRSWNEPMILIDSSPDVDYDPNITVVGDTVIVASTTVPPTHGQFVSTSRTLVVRSVDNGRTWSSPEEIETGYRYVAGKIHNGVVLADGTAMFPFSWDVILQKAERVAGEPQMDSRVSFMATRDGGKTWFRKGDVKFDRRESADAARAVNGLDEPAVIMDGDRGIYMLCRTAADRLYELRSSDGGDTWSSARPSPLTSYQSPAALCSISGDRPGWLVVWCNSTKHRWPLCTAASFDRGKTWSTPRELAPQDGFQSSYPSCIQAADGKLVAVWQQDRRDLPRTLGAARFDMDWLLSEDSDH